MLANALTERAVAVTQLVNTPSDSVLSNSVLLSPSVNDASLLQPCSHKESDDRIIFHISYFVTEGMTQLIVKTTNMDVIVSVVTNAQRSLQCCNGNLHSSWCQEELQLHSCTPDFFSAWAMSCISAVNVSCLHRVQHCLLFAGKGKGIENLASIPRSHICIPLCLQ